jgi:hypothetical protein
MTFFEPPLPPPEREEREPVPWLGPADNVLGSPFALQLVLVRTPSVTIQVQHGLAFSNGFEFTLHLVRRERDRDQTGGASHRWMMGRRGGGDPLAPDVLRFGIEFADGRKATVFDHRPYEPGKEPSGPVLMQRGGGGGDRRYDVRFWVWPLPPAGSFAFVVEWPSEGIELTRHQIDAGQIIEAAANAEELWPGVGTDRAEWSNQVTLMSARRDS